MQWLGLGAASATLPAIAKSEQPKATAPATEPLLYWSQSRGAAIFPATECVALSGAAYMTENGKITLLPTQSGPIGTIVRTYSSDSGPMCVVAIGRDY